jgi:hypothetical protein
VFGGLGGYLGHRAFEYYKSEHDLTDLDKAIRINVVMFAALGLGVGLGAGVILGGRFGSVVKRLSAGVLAGVLAGIVYPTIVAALMPRALTSVLIPLDAGELLLWIGLATGLLGVIIPAVARTPTDNPPHPASP